MKITTILSSLLLACSLVACDESEGEALPSDQEREGAAEAEAPALAQAPHRVAGPATGSAAGPAEHLRRAKPGPVMPQARVAFEELSNLIDAKYVDGPLSEDELWTGAMEGVMARLVQLPEHRINMLMPPRAHQELLVGTQGRLVGVGIMIERVAEVLVIRRVIPGGPAESAGLAAGDRILGIDGERIKQMPLPDVVDRIRGTEGSTVDLFVQRDTEEWTQTITRGLVEVASVQSTSLSDQAGYVRVTSFTQTTAAELDEHLQRLEQEGATRLVLDLRQCPGGLLTASLDAAARFVPEGKTLMTIESPDAEPDVRLSEGEYPWQSRPLAVLIGSKTASSAEIVADAIRTHGRGRLIGETTVGKHTIESIHELSEGWAVKLSVSRFAAASGASEQGVGVRPDIRIPMTGELAAVEQLESEADPVLVAALELLRPQ